MVTARRTFSLEDQRLFGRLSGDTNPLHVDPVIARRTLYGRVVVHGVHLVLWALHTALQTPCRFGRLNVTFSSPVGIGDEVASNRRSGDDTHIDIVISVNGVRGATLKATLLPPAEGMAIPDASPDALQCRALSDDAIRIGEGELPLLLDRALFARLFGTPPMIPTGQVATLLATTRLVGMECPGLNSIYSQLTLIFADGRDSAPAVLRWRTEDYDERFRRLSLAVAGPGCTGSLVAFVRPDAAPQPEYGAVAARVSANSFAGQRALVVGGSRGIGEVCAKALAASGATVRVTYRRGRDDAHRIVREIVAGGGDAQAFACDVLDAAALDPLLFEWQPTHIYYFATPPVFVGARGVYRHDLFAAFYDVYVRGLANVYAAVRARSRDELTIFYPSSVVLDKAEANMGEYAAAKAAGEAYCRFLASSDSKLHIRVTRLPRIRTDQTMSLMPVPADEALDWVLDVLQDQSPVGDPIRAQEGA